MALNIISNTCECINNKIRHLSDKAFKVEFKIEKELVKFNVDDLSFICNTEQLADYEHTMFVANSINFPTKNIVILVKIESISQSSRFKLIQNNKKIMENILINVEIEDK